MFFFVQEKEKLNIKQNIKARTSEDTYVHTVCGTHIHYTYNGERK